jgi:hypothetical protein
MEALCSSETLENSHQVTRRHIFKVLHSRLCKKLKAPFLQAALQFAAAPPPPPRIKKKSVDVMGIEDEVLTLALLHVKIYEKKKRVFNKFHEMPPMHRILFNLMFFLTVHHSINLF